MLNEPTMLPLSELDNIYALHDERGNTIGTGTREVCEVLLCILKQSKQLSELRPPKMHTPARPNVRAAIAI